MSRGLLASAVTRTSCTTPAELDRDRGGEESSHANHAGDERVAEAEERASKRQASDGYPKGVPGVWGIYAVVGSDGAAVR